MLKDRRDWPRQNTRLKFLARTVNQQESIPAGSTREYLCTSTSRTGLFLSTEQQQRVGDTVCLEVASSSAKAGATLVGKVVRVVPNAQGLLETPGAGIQLERLISPQGIRPAIQAWEQLFNCTWRNDTALEGPVEIDLPTAEVHAYVPDNDDGEAGNKSQTKSMPALVFAENLILRGTLNTLENGLSVVMGIRLPLDLGSEVRVQPMYERSPLRNAARTRCVVNAIEPSENGYNVILKQHGL